jgi:hypothetical protein
MPQASDIFQRSSQSGLESWPTETMADLLSDSGNALDVQFDTSLSLLAKATTLWLAAANLAGAENRKYLGSTLRSHWHERTCPTHALFCPSEESADSWVRHAAMSTGIARFIVSLPNPSIRNSAGQSRHGFLCVTDPVLVQVHIIAASASLLIHLAMPEDLAHHTECLTAVQYIISVIESVDAACLKYLSASLTTVSLRGLRSTISYSLHRSTTFLPKSQARLHLPTDFICKEMRRLQVAAFSAPLSPSNAQLFQALRIGLQRIITFLWSFQPYVPGLGMSISSLYVCFDEVHELNEWMAPNYRAIHQRDHHSTLKVEAAVLSERFM